MTGSNENPASRRMVLTKAVEDGVDVTAIWRLNCGQGDSRQETRR